MSTRWRRRHSAYVHISGSPDNLRQIANKYAATIQNVGENLVFSFQSELVDEKVDIGTGTQFIAKADVEPPAHRDIVISAPKITRCHFNVSIPVNLIIRCETVSNCKFEGRIADSRRELQNTNKWNPSVSIAKSSSTDVEFYGLFDRVHFEPDCRCTRFRSSHAGMEVSAERSHEGEPRALGWRDRQKTDMERFLQELTLSLFAGLVVHAWARGQCIPGKMEFCSVLTTSQSH